MRRTIAFTAAAVLLAAPSSEAQTVNLWPGAAPGSENWTQKEQTLHNTPLGTVLINVVTPTLTAFLPERPTAAATGVIVAPGGGFVALAIDHEGNSVARWLAARGIAAFVLKYRTMEKRGEGPRERIFASELRRDDLRRPVRRDAEDPGESPSAVPRVGRGR